MVGPLYFLLYVFLATFVDAVVEEAVVKDCEGGRSVGEIWTEEFNQTCRRYTCMDGTTIIDSCDDLLFGVAIEDGCYFKSYPGKAGAKYPECCQKDVLFCPDQPGYKEEELLQHIVTGLPHAMDTFIQECGIYIAVGIGMTAAVIVGLAYFDRSSKAPVKRQGSVKVKTGSVSEMAQAFDQASKDTSPVITGRQTRQRVKDDVFN